MREIIYKHAAIDAAHKNYDTILDFKSDGRTVADSFEDIINALPSAQPEPLTDDDFETIRIHLNAFKEELCNQRRWKEAEEYERIIDRFMAFASAQPQSTMGQQTGTAQSTNDLISRQAVDKIIDDLFKNDSLQASPSVWHGLHMIKQLPSAQQWIPFETREPDAEEKEDHPEWEYILCGNRPEEGQRILVNIKYKGNEVVQMDEYMDDGGYCYLDSGYDIGTEATAWMPLPEPYKGEDNG